MAGITIHSSGGGGALVLNVLETLSGCINGFQQQSQESVSVARVGKGSPEWLVAIL